VRKSGESEWKARSMNRHAGRGVCQAGTIQMYT